jgi:hypothetical protein
VEKGGRAVLISSADRQVQSCVPLVDDYEGLRVAARHLRGGRGAESVVRLELPELDDQIAGYLGVPMRWSELAVPEWSGRTFLLDLMSDPNTRTTKIFASLLIVLRAVHHVRRTGERLMLLTPSSGNKAVGLREAVGRAYAQDLVDPSQLRIAVLIPGQSSRKLRASRSIDESPHPQFAPVLLGQQMSPATVKQICADVAEAWPETSHHNTSGWTLWNTLDIDNYKLADVGRAFAEARFRSPSDPEDRWHAHAVSSAYGLLGYSLGVRLLQAGAYPRLDAPRRHPGLFIVQHMATSDMVRSVMLAVKQQPPPEYQWSPETATWEQGDSPEFPPSVEDLNESIDPTFYTSAPPTRYEFDDLVRRHGGGGIVVSRSECERELDRTKARLAQTFAMTGDESDLAEWSLAKVFTGVELGRQRGLIPEGKDVVIHASGHYTDDMLPPFCEQSMHVATSAADVDAALAGLARA